MTRHNEEQPKMTYHQFCIKYPIQQSPTGRYGWEIGGPRVYLSRQAAGKARKRAWQYQRVAYASEPQQ